VTVSCDVTAYGLVCDWPGGHHGPHHDWDRHINWDLCSHQNDDEATS